MLFYDVFIVNNMKVFILIKYIVWYVYEINNRLIMWWLEGIIIGIIVILIV